MNHFLDSILDRPKRDKIGILAVVVILLLMVGYLYAYSPQDAEIGRLSQDVESAENERNKKRQQAANRPKLQKDLQELEARLKEAVAQLPNKKEIPELLRSISTKARESGLEIMLFRPRSENYQDFYAEIPVEVVVKGHFFNVVSFFDEVGRLTRLVNMNNIVLKNPKVTGDRVILETSTMATTFRFLGEAERKKIAEQKAKAAKGKK
ncbi:MAG: type 4a pilus biogenesis protein PilO [Candidatus Binatia bacterium]